MIAVDQEVEDLHCGRGGSGIRRRAAEIGHRGSGKVEGCGPVGYGGGGNVGYGGTAVMQGEGAARLRGTSK